MLVALVANLLQNCCTLLNFFCLGLCSMPKFPFEYFWMTVIVIFPTFYVHLSAYRYYNCVIFYLVV